VDKLDLPWQIVVMRSVPEDAASQLMAKVQPLLAEFGYATLALFGREQPAVILRAANKVPVAEVLLDEIDRLFAFDPATSLSYVDARRGISKRVMLEAGRVTGVRLTGETAARDWLKDAMAEGIAVEPVRRWVLAPLSAPPAGSHSRGRIVCTCLNVAESEIRAEIAQGADLTLLQEKLKCGTECGSCLPELKQLIRMKKAA
jgi:assimilatory nitrate reductase catalytic subunit